MSKEYRRQQVKYYCKDCDKVLDTKDVCEGDSTCPDTCKKCGGNNVIMINTENG